MARIIHDGRVVIGNQRSGTLHLAEGLHYFVHIHVPIVLEGLVKDGQGGADVAEVHAKDLAPRAEVLDHTKDILAHFLAALAPGAYAERKSPVLTAPHQFIGSPVPVTGHQDYV